MHCVTMDQVEVCEPLKTLKELLSWKANKSDWSVLVSNLISRSSYCYSAVDLSCHKRTKKPVKLLCSSVPKTLVCHDMKGGYIDDKYVNGYAYNHQYLFYHWSVIDIFVYFSHHFVTIPPLSWVNAAHNHGVKILGTLITEHLEGEKLWKEILQDVDVQNQTIDQLVAVQNHFNFDGYLVNIENQISSDQLEKLINFLKNLKSKMKTGLLIWYDAVSLTSGELEWQNELNQHNKSAFEICDGVFLNYSWTSQSLQNSLVNAGVKLQNVFVGVDVFGRGCFGGGGFNSNVALSVIRSFGLSAAIFGPGWTHETQASDIKFFETENKFWKKLFPYLYVHCLNSIPFETNFNKGVGIYPEKQLLWYNLSLQSFPLSLPSCLNEQQDQSCFDISIDNINPNSIGSCLRLNFLQNETDIHKLMMCDFVCSEDSPRKCSISVKPIAAEFNPILLLLSVENDDQNFSVSLNVSNQKALLYDENDFSHSYSLAKEINLTKTVQVSSDMWITNTFHLKFNGTIYQISAKIQSSVLIGKLTFE